MVDTSPLIPQGDEGKIGHKICGEFCDHLFCFHSVSSLSCAN